MLPRVPVGGLLPLGSLTQNGLMNMGRSFRNYAGSMADFGNDVNLLHEHVDEGEHMIRIGSVTINAPAKNGMLKHIQRMGKGNVTLSQEITQYFYDAINPRTLVRRGKGDMSFIIWSDWTVV